MPTFRSRRNKDGSISYTATIRLSDKGRAYSESKTAKDRKALDRWAKLRERELKQDGVIEALKHKGTTIGNVLKWYINDFQGESQFGRTKLSHINYLLKLPISQVDAVSITKEQVIEHAKSRTASPSTINNDLIWLKNAMRDVKLSRGIPVNVKAIDDAAYILRKGKFIAKSKSRSRRPTVDEIEKLLGFFGAQRKAEIPMCDIIMFALFSSRRQEEITSIRWKDMDERRQGVLVREMKHPRDKKDTFCHVPDRAWDVIMKQDRKDERIFPCVSKSISAAFTRACKMCGIDDLRFHDLRHEAISHLFELGWDIPRVALVSGHKSWQSLQRYTNLSGHGEFDKWGDNQWMP